MTLIDSCADGLDLASTLEKVKTIGPQLAVLDTSTPSIYADIDTGARIKELLPDCCVVLMGTHPTALPKETLDNKGSIGRSHEADYTVWS